MVTNSISIIIPFAQKQKFRSFITSFQQSNTYRSTFDDISLNQIQNEELKEVIKILCITSKSGRSSEKIVKLNSFLQKTELFKLISPYDEGEILYKLSKMLRLRKFKGNTCLFRYGDYGDEFYLILYSSISILFPIVDSISTSPVSLITFIKYLIELHFNQEEGLFIQTVKSNKNIFNFNLLIENIYENNLNDHIDNSIYIIKQSPFPHNDFFYILTSYLILSEITFPITKEIFLYIKTVIFENEKKKYDQLTTRSHQSNKSNNSNRTYINDDSDVYLSRHKQSVKFSIKNNKSSKKSSIVKNMSEYINKKNRKSIFDYKEHKVSQNIKQKINSILSKTQEKRFLSRGLLGINYKLDMNIYIDLKNRISKLFNEKLLYIIDKQINEKVSIIEEIISKMSIDNIDIEDLFYKQSYANYEDYIYKNSIKYVIDNNMKYYEENKIDKSKLFTSNFLYSESNSYKKSIDENEFNINERKQKLKSFNNLNKLNMDNDSKQSSNFNEKSISNQNNNNNNNSENHKKDIIIDEDNEKNYFLFNYNFKVYIYNRTHTMKSGYFGETSIQSSTYLRNATVFTNETSYFSVLSKENYISTIKEIINKDLITKSNLLIKSILFERIDPLFFSINLLKYFSLRKCEFNETIYDMNTELNNYFFISTGVFELGCKSSILNLIRIYEEIVNDSVFQKSLNSEKEVEECNIEIKKMREIHSQLNSDKDIKIFFEKVIYNKIFVLSPFEVIGCFRGFVNSHNEKNDTENTSLMKSFFIMKSKKINSIIYSISKEMLDSILNQYSSRQKLRKIEIIRMKTLKERLFELVNYQLDFYKKNRKKNNQNIENIQNVDLKVKLLLDKYSSKIENSWNYNLYKKNLNSIDSSIISIKNKENEGKLNVFRKNENTSHAELGNSIDKSILLGNDLNLNSEKKENFKNRSKNSYNDSMRLSTKMTRFKLMNKFIVGFNEKISLISNGIENQSENPFTNNEKNYGDTSKIKENKRKSIVLQILIDEENKKLKKSNYSFSKGEKILLNSQSNLNIISNNEIKSKINEVYDNVNQIDFGVYDKFNNNFNKNPYNNRLYNRKSFDFMISSRSIERLVGKNKIYNTKRMKEEDLYSLLFNNK